MSGPRKPRHRSLAAFYEDFRRNTVEPALSPALSQEQADMIRLSMRMAFYSGAITIWSMFMSVDGLDPGEEPTASDMALMNTIDSELKAFVREIGRLNDEHTRMN